VPCKWPRRPFSRGEPENITTQFYFNRLELLRCRSNVGRATLALSARTLACRIDEPGLSKPRISVVS